VKHVPSEDDQPTLSEADGIRYLHFGTEWIQGAMAVAEPATLVLEYTRQMMAWLLFVPPPKAPQAIANLGLGAGSLTRFCLKRTRSPVRVVEWNPQVVAVCDMYFKLKPTQRRLQVECEDAALWVANPANHDTCPVVMVDLYDAEARGPVRDSVEFYRDCRRVIGEAAGVLSVNLFGAHESFEHNLANLDEAFDGHVLLLPEMDAGNRIALALTGDVTPLDAGLLLDRAEQVEAEFGLPARRWARSLLRRPR